MSGLPGWLAQRITTTTGIDPRGTTRRARAGACTHCAAPVLRGLDDTWLALPAETDPTRLTTLGEILALTTGRATYTLNGHPPELDYRDQYRIRGHPADTVVVLPAHKCGAPPLPAFPPAEKKRMEYAGAAPF